MRSAAFAVCVCALWLAGCGYVGPVVPPSPQIPLPVGNLDAVERGDQIVITFSTPPRTVDSLPIDEFSHIDLRVGLSSEPFNEAQWDSTAKAYQVEQHYAGSDEDAPRSVTISRAIPVSEWQGKKVDILVRTAVKKHGHFSSWSNRVSLNVVQPLKAPDLQVEAGPDGYRLTWSPVAGASRYQVMRQGPNEPAPSVVGISAKPEYVDGTAQWDTTYQYSAVSQAEKVESLPSAPVAINKPDTFAPAVPTNLVALAGPESIELSWTRNTETDFKGYAVFRSVNGGAFERQGDLITLPSYSDRKVEHGKTYRYVISAVDQKGNPSAKSVPAEVAY